MGVLSKQTTGVLQAIASPHVFSNASCIEGKQTRLNKYAALNFLSL